MRWERFLPGQKQGSSEMTRITQWAEGRDSEDSGVEVSGIKITWAEIEDVTSPAMARDRGIPDALIEEYERQDGTWTEHSLADWLGGIAEWA